MNIRRAERRRRYGELTREQWAMLLTRDMAAFRLATFGTFAAFVLSIVACTPLAVWITARLPPMKASWAGPLAAAIVLGPAAIIGLATLCGTRRWCVMRQIGRAVCPACGYGLGGLSPSEGAVSCPECGCIVALNLYDIRAEDLVPNGPDDPRGAL